MCAGRVREEHLRTQQKCKNAEIIVWCGSQADSAKECTGQPPQNELWIWRDLGHAEMCLW